MIKRVAALAAVAVALPATASAQTPRRAAEQPRQAVVVEVADGGFHWGDAAIGAAAASGAALAMAGLSMFRRQQREGT